MKKNSILCTLMCLVSLGSLASCGPKTSESTDTSKPDPTPAKKEKLVLSGAEDQRTFVMGKANEYLRAQKLDSKYELTYTAHGEDKIDSEVADWTAETAPDLYSFSCDKSTPLAAAGALATVPDEYAEQMKKTLSETAYASATFNGDLVGYAYTASNGYFTYYDSSLPGIDAIVHDNKAGSIIDNIEDWLKYCEDNGKTFAYNLKEAFYTVGALTTFGASWKVEYNRDGSVKKITSDFASDKGLKAAKMILKIMSSDAVVYTQDAPGVNNVAFCVNGAWALSNDSEGNKSAYTDAKVKTTTLPNATVGTEKKHIRSFAGTKLYGVNPSKSNGKAERLNTLHGIANYLTSDDVQSARFDESQQAPSSKAVSAMDKVKSNAALSALANQSADGMAQANLPGNIWSAPATFATWAYDNAKSEVSDDVIMTQLQQLDTAVQASK